MLLNIISAVILAFVLHVCEVNCYSGNAVLSQKNSKNRQKRFLNFYFEYNSCYALAVVMSLPLDLSQYRQVFFSWNFETNYYYPYFDNANGLIPLPFTLIDEPGSNAGTKHRIDLPPGYRKFNEETNDAQLDNGGKDNKTAEILERKLETNENGQDATKILNAKKEKKDAKKDKPEKSEKRKTKNRKTRSLFNNYFMSRRRFFKMMESNMDSSGFKGHECLLKTICETSEDSFGLHNGVIGSVVDILFLPSTSKDEKLPKSYYQAEANGKLSNCAKYNKACPISIFDFITKKI